MSIWFFDFMSDIVATDLIFDHMLGNTLIFALFEQFVIKNDIKGHRRRTTDFGKMKQIKWNKSSSQTINTPVRQTDKTANATHEI